MREEKLTDRVWDTIVETVVLGGGFEGFERKVKDILAEMDVEELCEMSWQELIDKVDEELG